MLADKLSTNLWRLSASYLPIPFLLTRIPLLSKYFCHQVVWHPHSSTLLWREIGEESCTGETCYMKPLNRACYYRAPLHHVKILSRAFPGDLDYQDRCSDTPLHSTLYRSPGSFQFVKAILEAKADPNVCTQSNTSPLLNAVYFSYAKTIRVLIEHGANPNLADMEGFTPLMEACKQGYLCTVKMLLAHNANVFAMNSSGKTAIDLAREHWNYKIVGLLEQHTS